MDWISRGNSNFTLTKSTSDSLLKRSASTISLNGVKTELCLREAKSFTGALDEFRYMDSSTETENCQVSRSLIRNVNNNFSVSLNTVAIATI